MILKQRGLTYPGTVQSPGCKISTRDYVYFPRFEFIVLAETIVDMHSTVNPLTIDIIFVQKMRNPVASISLVAENHGRCVWVLANQ